MADETGREDLDGGLETEWRRGEGCALVVLLALIAWAVIAAAIICLWP